MTPTEYEQKKRECWNEAVLHGALEVDKDLLFDHAFKCGYELGKQTETITQEEIKETAKVYSDNHYEEIIDGINDRPSWDALEDGIREAYISGANFTLGKQEKYAEKTKIDGKITISLHVAVIPRQEEFYMGVDASHEAYTIDIPKSMIPSDLLAVINGECNNKVVTNIAIMK